MNESTTAESLIVDVALALFRIVVINESESLTGITLFANVGMFYALE